jgi:hypothetical protein
LTEIEIRQLKAYFETSHDAQLTGWLYEQSSKVDSRGNLTNRSISFIANLIFSNITSALRFERFLGDLRLFPVLPCFDNRRMVLTDFSASTETEIGYRAEFHFS